jgi:hypothetical protein
MPRRWPERQALATIVKDEIARWTPVIKSANISRQ